MRKIRKAAIASAAAVSLVFGATTIAAAETDKPNTEEAVTAHDKVSDEVGNDKGNKSPKSNDVPETADPCNYRKTDGKLDQVIQDAILKHNDPDCQAPTILETAKKTAKSRNSSFIGDAVNADVPVTGKDLSGQNVNSSRQPAWSQIWIIGAAIGVIGTVIGLGILPIINQLRAQGVIL